MLLVSVEGYWDAQERGIEGGDDAPIALAAAVEALGEEQRAELCEALEGTRLTLGHGQGYAKKKRSKKNLALRNARLRGSFVSPLCVATLDLFPDVASSSLAATTVRAGAVLLDEDGCGMVVYLGEDGAVLPVDAQDAVGAKLLGHVTADGMAAFEVEDAFCDGLCDWQCFCALCNGEVRVQLKSVRFEDDADGGGR